MLPHSYQVTEIRHDLSIDRNSSITDLSDSMNSLNFCSVWGKLYWHKNKCCDIDTCNIKVFAPWLNRLGLINAICLNEMTVQCMYNAVLCKELKVEHIQCSGFGLKNLFHEMTEKVFNTTFKCSGTFTQHEI